MDIQHESKDYSKAICAGNADSFSLGGEQTRART